MVSASRIVSWVQVVVSRLMRWYFAPSLTGRAQKRSSWLSELVPIAAPTIPTSRPARPPKSSRHSLLPVSVVTRHAPCPAV